jgi:Dolichyl-phosphate-mannose-protein mannosyltransferase
MYVQSPPWLDRVVRPQGKPALRYALAVTVAARLGLQLVAAVVTAVASPHPYAEQAFFTPPAVDPLLSPFQREDALWYQHIAASGYAGLPQAAAFMPLFPLLIRLAGALIGSQPVAGLLIPTLCTAAALYLLFDLTERELSAAAARRTVLLIAVAPAAYFLWSPFTESLFLLESVAVFWLARRGRYEWAGLIVAFAVLTRLQGALLLIPLLGFIADARRRRTLTRPATLRACFAAVSPSMVAATGVVIVAGADSGVGLLGAQALWGAHLAPPWTVVASSIATVVQGRHPEELLNLASVVGVAVSLPAMRRLLPLPYALFTAASLLAILCHVGGNSPLMSASRFCTVIFPALMVLGSSLRRRRQYRLVALVFATACALLFAATVEYVFVA